MNSWRMGKWFETLISWSAWLESDKCHHWYAEVKKNMDGKWKKLEKVAFYLSWQIGKYTTEWDICPEENQMWDEKLTPSERNYVQ